VFYEFLELYGERSSVGRALGCGSKGRGFEPRRSPHFLGFMSKKVLSFSCVNCGSGYAKWVGKCSACGEWNTITEEKPSLQGKIIETEVPELNSIAGELHFEERINSNSGELNRVLGGGIVAGSSVLIGGEPGVGKSTLLLNLASKIASNGREVVYLSGEESVNQIRLRAKRMGLENSTVKLAFLSSLSSILSILNSLQKGGVAIIDSIQTIVHEEVAGSAGSVIQVRACVDELLRVARSREITIFLIGHINKEGQIAGPKVLEHMVDVVLYFEEDLTRNFRILRNIKNRFGSVQETGIFKMSEGGLVEVPNPSAMFLSNSSEDKVGNIVFAGTQGTRPLMLEVEALLTPSFTSFPKRVVVGWDANRLSMICAVLQTHLKIKLHEKEIYLNLAGGLKTLEPSADLAVASSIFSALLEVPISKTTICFGEISLSGDVRPVQFTESRVKEAFKLGYKTVLCPPLTEENRNLTSYGEVIEVKNLKSLRYLIK
jgi:DNA repair protein RadA/Sms